VIFGFFTDGRAFEKEICTSLKEKHPAKGGASWGNLPKRYLII
jgi:hypothetical protein